MPPTGSSLSNTYILAEAFGGSQRVKGIIIASQREHDGNCDFDAQFTAFTTDKGIVEKLNAASDADALPGERRRAYAALIRSRR